MLVSLFVILQGALVFCISYAVLKVSYVYWSKRRQFRLGSKFKGPKTAPFVGSWLLLKKFPDYSKFTYRFPGLKYLHILKDVLEFSVTGESILLNVKKFTKQYGRNTIPLYFGWDLYLYIVNANDVQTVLNNALGKAPIYDVVKIYAGEGLFSAAVPNWKHNRKLLNPSFNIKVLENYVKIFNEESKIMTDELKSLTNGSEFDVCQYTCTTTFRTLWRTILEYNLEPEVIKKADEYQQFGQKIIFGRLFNLWEQSNFIFNRTKNGRTYAKTNGYIQAIFDKVIQDKNATLNKKNPCDIETEKFNLTNDGIQKQKAFMNIIFDKENNWTDKQKKDEICTFVFAGSDTGAHNVAYVLMMLGMYQDLQNKCYQELHEVLGDSDRDVEMDDLKRLTYLEQCFKETLRLFPTVPLIAREVLEDIKISDGIIPAGANVLIGIHEMHKDPNVFPNPDKFDPDRFSPENIKKRAPNTYIPFSTGPRNCIGLTYARMSAIIQLAHILKKYEIICKVKIEDIRVSFAGISGPVGGFPIYIRARNPIN